MGNNIKNHKVIIYQSANGAIQLRSDVSAETLWATQKQIAEIFGVNTPAINKHIRNILSERELDDSTISILEIVQKEGTRQVRRKVEHYNLDMLISIGYRVNSNTLTTLTLLIAESAPRQKEQMVGLVLQLLREGE